jgi:1,4-dihydroxy-2-naphthoate octaprenyltransferase
MASSRSVRAAALAGIGFAGVAGLSLALATTLWLIPLGAVAMLALWLYSGGPRPYADLGLGEVMVFVFFGLMATAGTAYVQAEAVSANAWWGAAAMGSLAVAILVANNLRDIPTDAATGKRTLAVRLGDRRTRSVYRACVVAPFVVVGVGALVHAVEPSAGLSPWELFAWASAPLAVRPLSRIGNATGRELIPVLIGTGLLQVAFAALLALGLWIDR